MRRSKVLKFGKIKIFSTKIHLRSWHHPWDGSSQPSLGLNLEVLLRRCSERRELERTDVGVEGANFAVLLGIRLRGDVRVAKC